MPQQPRHKKLTVLIIDDEPRAAAALSLLLQKLAPAVSETHICTEARAAAALILDVKPHLVFLDIRMPHQSGFELLEQLPNRDFGVIFTTAYHEYAIKAIRFSAFDYLLKPIDPEELLAALDRFEARRADTFRPHLFTNMINNLQSGESHFQLAIPYQSGVHFVRPSTIVYCEAVSNYTRFFLKDGSQLLASKTLGSYEDLLEPYHFFRCHKSFLLNLRQIAYVDHEGYVMTTGKSRIPVSGRKKPALLALLKSQNPPLFGRS